MFLLRLMGITALWANDAFSRVEIASDAATILGVEESRAAQLANKHREPVLKSPRGVDEKDGLTGTEIPQVRQAE